MMISNLTLSLPDLCIFWKRSEYSKWRFTLARHSLKAGLHLRALRSLFFDQSFHAIGREKNEVIPLVWSNVMSAGLEKKLKYIQFFFQASAAILWRNLFLKQIWLKQKERSQRSQVETGLNVSFFDCFQCIFSCFENLCIVFESVVMALLCKIMLSFALCWSRFDLSFDKFDLLFVDILLDYILTLLYGRSHLVLNRLFYHSLELLIHVLCVSHFVIFLPRIHYFSS